MRCMAASQERAIPAHEQLGSGVGVARRTRVSANPMNTPFGTDWERGARRNGHGRPCLYRACSRAAGAERGPRYQRGKCVGYYECVRRPCGLMDKALVFGTKDCRLESCQGHMSDWSRQGPSASLGLVPCWREARRLSVKPAAHRASQGGGVAHQRNAKEARPPPPAARLAARWRVHAIKRIGPSTQHHVTWRVPLVS